MNLEELQNKLRGCSVVVEVEAVSNLTQYNCLLVNDHFLLSYAEAESIINRTKAAKTFTGKLSNFAERLTGWLLQFVYRACFSGQRVKPSKSKELINEAEDGK